MSLMIVMQCSIPVDALVEKQMRSGSWLLSLGSCSSACFGKTALHNNRQTGIVHFGAGFFFNCLSLDSHIAYYL